MGKLLVLLTLTTAICAAKDELASRKPVFQYRYQTEDVMQTAASTIPVKGYHVVEGGYYPAEIGIGAGIGGAGIGGAGIGGAGIGGAGLAGAGIGGAGLAGAGIGGAGIGGAGLGYKGIGYGGYGGGIGLGGAGIGLGGAGIGAGKFIGGGLGGAGLIGAGGAGLYGAPGLIHAGGAGLGGAGLIHAGGAGLIGAGGAGLYGGGAGLYGAGAGLYGGGAGLIGAGGAGGAGLYGGGAGIVGGPFIHGIGGEVIDKGVYGGGKKILNDVAFEKASGQRGEEFDAGKEGFHKGIAAAKNNKGEHAYYNDAAAGKKIADDAKTYYGGQHFDKEGTQGGEFNEKKAHKKGHKIKGFKTSHHKDETGKTEEYYDEENDEGGKINFSGTHGSFGEKGASSFKGGHENGEFIENGHKKQGHFDSEHLVDHNNADLGKYGEKKYGGSGAVFGVNNGIDQHSLLGHQENSKIYKHFPHHVPFY